jgi:hypothetical protein
VSESHLYDVWRKLLPCLINDCDEMPLARKRLNVECDNFGKAVGFQETGERDIVELLGSTFK